MYQTGEQVWAGLAHQIIEQVTQRMTRAEREHFWLHLNRTRVDEQAVRRKIYGLVIDRLAPYAIGGLFVLIAGVIVLVAGGVNWPGLSLTALGPVAVVVATVVNAVKVLGSSPAGRAASLLRPADDAVQFAGKQFESAYEQLVENPDYRRRSGALYLVHSDIARVLELVATKDRPLVIFVDDLDRCSPGTVVQVIEAINLFVAGDYSNSIFVIAMGPEMVAAHIEAAYGDLVQKLEQTSGTSSQAFDLGWRFLEKIVQLPLALPTMETTRTSSYFDGLFSHEAEHTGDGGGVQADTGGKGIAEQPVEAPNYVADTIAGVAAPDAETRRREISRKLTVDDRLVKGPWITRAVICPVTRVRSSASRTCSASSR